MDRHWVKERHTIFIQHCDYFEVIPEKITIRELNTNKHFSLGDVTNWTAACREFETDSGGINILGPSYRVEIPYAGRTTFDDMVSFTASDYTHYMDCSGIDLTIGTLSPTCRCRYAYRLSELWSYSRDH